MILVRVVLECQLSVSLLDLGIGCVLVHAQDIVVLCIVRLSRSARHPAHAFPKSAWKATPTEETSTKHS